MAAISPTQFDLVYDVLSFSLATMMATTIFLWMRVVSLFDHFHSPPCAFTFAAHALAPLSRCLESQPAAAEKYKSALIISGLVTFIAAYHYLRIFNSWVEAYAWQGDGTLAATGVPFNDAYRYMDWLLTVPLLLIEIVLVMKLPADEMKSQATSLGVASALMIVLGYPGELVLTNLGTRWFYWIAAMVPFLYIVKTLLVGLNAATNSEDDPAVRGLIRGVQWWTVISWCTYPVVYLFPMLGIGGVNVVVFIQLGYSVSDIISKCGVGLMIYQITMAKSAALQKGKGEETPLYS